MKKNIWILAVCMAALTITTIGCNNDEPTENLSTDKFTINASIKSGADTRLLFKDEKTSLKLNWRTKATSVNNSTYDDCFVVFTEENNQTPVLFTIASVDADAHNATFTPESSFLPTAGKRLYAYFKNHGKLSGENNPTAIPLDLTNQFGNPDSLSASHFSMYASGITDGTDNIKFAFQHVNAIIKLVLTFSDANAGDYVYNVGLSSPDIHQKATLNITNGVMTYLDSDKGDVRTYDSYYASRNLLNANKATTVWLSVFPENLTNVKVVAKSRDGSIIYEGSLDDCNLVAGRMYTATATLTKKTN